MKRTRDKKLGKLISTKNSHIRIRHIFVMPINNSLFYFNLMDGCTQDCIEILGKLSIDEMCGYTQNHCIQDTVQFIQMYYCTFHSSFILLLFFGVII